MTTGETAEPGLFEVAELSVVFPESRGGARAVDRVSFTVGSAESLGIVGESGSGKSMLMRAVMGLAPTGAAVTGRAVFLGRDILTMSRRDARSLLGAQIAMVFQNPMSSLNPVLTIGRQVSEPLELHRGMRRRQARSEVHALLASVGITDVARRVRSYPHELSGGMRQRVSIAIAIACGPSLLIADEPTTALDVTTQKQVLDLLDDLRRDRLMSVMLVSHDLSVVAGRTDRVMVMYGGQIVESGPTRDLIDAPRHPYTAALLAATPRLDQPSHTRLSVVPSGPVRVATRTRGCRFAPRCQYARDVCRTTDPVLTAHAGQDERQVACFFPLSENAIGRSTK